MQPVRVSDLNYERNQAIVVPRLTHREVDEAAGDLSCQRTSSPGCIVGVRQVRVFIQQACHEFQQLCARA
jgi:hypothetical protein